MTTKLNLVIRYASMPFFGVCYILLVIFASFTSLAAAQNFTQGYHSDDSDLKTAMVVALSPNSTADKPTVERASNQNVTRVIGISASANDSLVTISSAEQQIYVQTSGVVRAYTSNINGNVKKGDSLSISPLKGVLMLDDQVSPIIGTALEDFPNVTTETQTVKARDGGEKIVKIAKINISLNKTQNSSQVQPASNSSLSQIGKSITGNDVGELRVIAALIVFLVVMIAEGSIIYGAVSTGITSLGRNPLAKKFIRGEMIRVLALALVVLGVGLASIFALLGL